MRYPTHEDYCSKLVMHLHHQVTGSGEPIIILHGLFGSLSNWNSIAKRLSQSNTVITVDLRNHGRSEWSDDVSYKAMAFDIAELISHLDLSCPHVVGHSMGGKTAMTLALELPDLVKSLTVVDIAPVSYGHSHIDLITTLLSVDLEKIQNRKDFDSTLEPLISDAGLRMFLAQNLVRDSSKYHWRINLQVLYSGMSELVGFPSADGKIYDKPALFVNGALSEYVISEYHPEIYRLFPKAEISTIEGAGHWLHAEKPKAMIEHTERFINHMV